MIIRKKKLEGTFEIVLEPHNDSRGFYMQTYDKNIFKKHGIVCDWVKGNESFSKHKGTVRGLHFQHPPYSEGKLMHLSSGKAFLVWVDLRKNSSTFGQWDSLELSSQKHNMIYTPRGFANGMCTLSNDCTLHYEMDNYFHPEKQDTISWNDLDLAIKWPVKRPKQLSERDSNAKSFKEFIDLYGGL